MLRLLTTADTEVLATAHAVRELGSDFPEVRAANLVDDVEAFADGAQVVVVRLLGGRRAWPEGVATLRALSERDGFALILLGGESEPDAELTELSRAPAGAIAQVFEYLRHGGVDNTRELLRFLADTFGLEGHGFERPRELAELGVYVPGVGDVDGLPSSDGRPRVGLVFYRSHRVTGNTAFVDALAGAIERAGGQPLCVWAYSLRGDAPALKLLDGEIGALITTVLASGGSHAGDEWHAEALEALGVPVIQALCATTSRQRWEESDAGLKPLDAAMQVAIPEFDGRIIGVPISFKEPFEDFDAVHYAPDSERCDRLAGLALGHARLRTLDRAEQRTAIVLSSFPTKHARVGNAVGLDTPASAMALLEALREAGHRVEHDFEDGDALIHALIASGGHDPEFLSDAHLQAAGARLPVADYTRWFATLPQALQTSINETWGPAPGEHYVDGGDFIIAGLSLGNVFVAIQPPRGYGENPVAIYHDPGLAPAHHYLATYRWLDVTFGADAIVHLGKHGTLEWLPGKALGLSAACAPDACLGSTPLFYPFVVNDPGEGMQAKRRAHAVLIDHLVPPMMRAETYDELAQLEQLLDEYARCEALDPAKLPALANRIWTLLHEADLHRDLEVEGEQPALEDFGALIEHVDGYLCEIKDLQVRDGLHILGRTPEGEQFRGLLGAILRLPGLRDALASWLGTHDGDVLAAAQDEVLDAYLLRGELPVDPGVRALVELARDEVVPKLRATPGELTALVGGLHGRHVPAGPSGSPTRGRLDVLPTGRNMYSVDPRALPSELAYETGAKLADALLASGELPETVGIVVWGTAAMRTAGDDAGEILALLGVRPRWNVETRRIAGLEVIGLEELGRPRIDVTVRISGFFRDAFPHLVELLDEAVMLVAGLDEPLDRNFVRKHVLADIESMAGDWRGATARIFGGRPGTYGTGILQLVDVRNWRDDADLAEVYEAWGGHAYGRGLDGVEARSSMRRQFARIDVAVKNVDTREHDLLDSSDYFAEHGGMIAYVRHLAGADPRAVIGDSSDPSSPAARSLAEEARRVFRSRVANPRWIGSMMRHGYKGAFELSATVDYLFGYDATTGVVDDWMYESVTERYVGSEEVRSFLARSNPWALRAIAERLLEAADRGLWEAPEPASLDVLRDAYLEVEGELEEAGT
ncbi:cobaltochelatase subunit CobN [Solirubrobacter ginsenosidimutans]|uniref:Cobaltochelatase subunit CobN n=1 Tax=Solirubrobacter ginsenosidimutans TaxID=490573 RepID=A0A9X3S3V5_9ACTN|nr:cobaltochelatase subunit CobN [Solirubrobacter ginsenosidimutans]MDA0162496.1 cobaltochelatase subunit CobN [Solirubrobacter ginsenosidimutans]